ncbi:MAG: hypothetical protein ABI674_08430 [Spartobacteria bacterium]
MQIKIGILGLGTVGCGTLNVERPVQFDPKIVSDDVDGLLGDPEIHLVATR